MQKTVIAPAQGHVEAGELDGPQCSLAVATHHPDCTRVEINGLVYPDGTARVQTRELLGLIEKILGDLDGSMADIVRLRWYVDDTVLDSATRGAIHEVRAEFFDYPQFPASCMIAVPSGESAATDSEPTGSASTGGNDPSGGEIELEATAIVPADGSWTVRTITGDETTDA